MRRRQLFRWLSGGIAAAVGLPLLPRPAAVPTDAAIVPAGVDDFAAWTRDYKYQTYGLGIKVTREACEDDLYGFHERLSSELKKLKPHA